MYTIGKRGSDDDFHVGQAQLRAAGAEVHTVPRGGETTFHGPGQLVAYPIVNLRELGVGPRQFVEGLEDVMARVVGRWGIAARVSRLSGAVVPVPMGIANAVEDSGFTPPRGTA